MPATVLLGQVCSVILFIYLLVILPFLGWFFRGKAANPWLLRSQRKFILP